MAQADWALYYAQLCTPFPRPAARVRAPDKRAAASLGYKGARMEAQLRRPVPKVLVLPAPKAAPTSEIGLLRTRNGAAIQIFWFEINISTFTDLVK